MEKLNDFLSETKNSFEFKRALAVKFVLQKYEYSWISEALNVSTSFISKWYNLYQSDGIEALKLNYRGKEGYFTDEQMVEVIKWLKEQEHWAIHLLKKHILDTYGVEYKSNQSYYAIMKKAKINWKKSQNINAKRDDELVEKKKKEIQKKMEGWKDEIESCELIVFFVDECHLLHGDVSGYVWGPSDKRIEIPIKNIRDKRTYYGALNAKTGEMVVKGYPKANSTHTISFVKYLFEQNEEKRIVIIWDGATYHKSEEFSEYLAEINGDLEEEQWLLTCIRFAPNDPSQNPIEDVWLQAKNYVRRIYHKLPDFKSVKKAFLEVLSSKFFYFDKLHMYG